MFTDLARILLVARDLELATGRYASLLGRRPSWRAPAAAGSTGFRLENTTLEIVSSASLAKTLAAAGASDREVSEGVAALVFGCDDISEVAAELEERGLGAYEPVEREERDEATDDLVRCAQALLEPERTRGVSVLAAEDRSPRSVPLAEPSVDPEQAVQGLDHVVVASRELAASRRLYGEGLGLRLALDRSFEKLGSRMLFFRIAGVTIEVVGAIEEDPERSSEPDRLGGLAWRVADVAGARARLLRDGFDVSEARMGRKPGTCVATVRSPTHGVPTLLIGPA